MDLELKNKLVKCYIYGITRSLDPSRCRSETPEKFLNLVLEKDREDQMDRSYEKGRSIAYRQGTKEYPT
jgi:hypothetical protein